MSDKEWNATWEKVIFGGASTRMALERISKRLGISLEVLKERIRTRTSKETERTILQHT